MKKILPYHQELFLMKSTGLKLISFLMIILLGLSPSLSWGQGSGKTVKGTLIDATTKEPLVGGNVLIKGTTKGASADANGQYSINVSDDKVVLVFRFLGYDSQEIAVGSRSTIDVSLKANDSSLLMLVVVVYGTKMKNEVRGCVNSVQVKPLIKVLSIHLSNYFKVK
jgi:hypothetical protein